MSANLEKVQVTTDNTKDMYFLQRAIPCGLAVACAVASVFLLLAAYQIMPQGVNAISQLGMVGQGLGYGMLASSLLIGSIGIYYLQKSDHHAHTQIDVAITKTMGQHIQAHQRTLILECFDVAMQALNPRQEFEQLINSKINVLNGWDAEKAGHIKANLMPLIPEKQKTAKKIERHQERVNKIRQIANQSINQTGDKLICFYKSGPTQFLSNFAYCSRGITVWGRVFKCAEAAFQWRKFCLAGHEKACYDLLLDPRMNKFLECDGEQAFQLSRNLETKYPGIFTAKWQNGERDQVMWDVLQAKFSQNPDMKELLEATQEAYLLAHTIRIGKDQYWSDNHDGSGENMLGRMLMALRNNAPLPDSHDQNDRLRIHTYADYANRH